MCLKIEAASDPSTAPVPEPDMLARLRLRFRILHRQCFQIVLASALVFVVPGRAQEKRPADLTEMNLEDLMNVKVTSVSKREERLARTAAAVFVISADDIRRSGATNIPDLLRMAPGVDVRQIDMNKWAISVRGFSMQYSNKVLVLVDGRSVYTPSFSGVYWDQIDIPLENIDRIEVIRGPGATVWGANAVNGVISILTKSSRETQGGLIAGAVGSQLAGQGTVQYGGTVGKNATYRGFVKSFSVRDGAGVEFPANDDWMRLQAGSRLDWGISEHDALMVQGSLYANHGNQTRRSSLLATPYDDIFDQRYDATGGNLLALWNHVSKGGSQTSIQSYFDTYRRTSMGPPESLRTFNFDFQNHLAPTTRHDLVWGFDYRVYDSSVASGYNMGLVPPSRTDSLVSGFIQDEIRLASSVWFTAGCKLEHNPYTGFQTEPSLRLLWSPASGRQTVWAAAASAVRQPSRADAGIRADLQTVPISSNLLQELRLYGNPEIKNEEARDFEIGYRSDVGKNLSVDVAAFLTFYRHLQTAEPRPPIFHPGIPARVEIPLVYDNKARAVTYGGELSLNWTVSSRWRIEPAYSYLHATIRQDASSSGLPSYTVATSFPQNMVRVSSQWSVTPKLDFDQALYYTARLPGSTIPGRARLDLRLARRISEATEISLVGQNLLRPRSLEFGDSYGVLGTQPVRSVYAKVIWTF